MLTKTNISLNVLGLFAWFLFFEYAMATICSMFSQLGTYMRVSKAS